MESTGFEPDLSGKWEVVAQDWRCKNLTEDLQTKNQKKQKKEKR
jgi:hypothetical protein